MKMDIDDGDDFYSDEKATPAAETKEEIAQPEQAPSEQKSPKSEDSNSIEEREEDDEEEDDDSDIEIVTERKDGTKAAAVPTAKYNDIRNIAQRTASNEVTKKPVAAKKDPAAKTAVPVAGSELPAERVSTIDVDAKPIYKPARKPITQVDIDRDLPEDNDKAWRRPGTDISDYFNYGFDEFTWALYAQKQESLRSEFDQSKIADNQKKMMEDMSMMMMGGGMPGMAGMPAAGGGMPGMPGMPGMDGNMPPEMQAMMQQMMAGGMDPNQMDPSMFGGGMPGQGGAAGGANPQGGNPNAGFGGQQQFGQGNQQQQFGYDQQMGGMGGEGQGGGQGGGDGGGGHGGGRGTFRGRGRSRGHRGGRGW